MACHLGSLHERKASCGAVRHLAPARAAEVGWMDLVANVPVLLARCPKGCSSDTGAPRGAGEVW